MALVEVTHTIDGKRIVLEARAFRLRRPFGRFLWSAPSAVRLPGPGGETRLPIRDLTRRRQITAYGISLICLAAGLLARGRPSE